MKKKNVQEFSDITPKIQHSDAKIFSSTDKFELAIDKLVEKTKKQKLIWRHRGRYHDVHLDYSFTFDTKTKLLALYSYSSNCYKNRASLYEKTIIDEEFIKHVRYNGEKKNLNSYRNIKEKNQYKNQYIKDESYDVNKYGVKSLVHSCRYCGIPINYNEDGDSCSRCRWKYPSW